MTVQFLSMLLPLPVVLSTLLNPVACVSPHPSLKHANVVSNPRNPVIAMMGHYGNNNIATTEQSPTESLQNLVIVNGRNIERESPQEAKTVPSVLKLKRVVDDRTQEKIDEIKLPQRLKSRGIALDPLPDLPAWMDADLFERVLIRFPKGATLEVLENWAADTGESAEQLSNMMTYFFEYWERYGGFLDRVFNSWPMAS